ncbi:fungal-specific transcription factor domain-containing protein [Biscogniauxia marginata]|nr:fungal-specific transcription factor domain-containing protein [Biscogniauxia marginata]
MDPVSTEVRDRRVCDKCRINKTKCNRQRPSCSRCVEHKWECAYSSLKRRPGPPKGYSLKARRLSTLQAQENPTPSYNPENTPCPSLPESDKSCTQVQNISLAGQVSTESNASTSPESSWKRFKLIDPDIGSTAEYGLHMRPQLSPQTELDLIEAFFRCVQPQFPLFQKHKFLCSYAAGQLQESLLSAVFAVSLSHSQNLEIAAMDLNRLSDEFAISAGQSLSVIAFSGAPAGVDDLKALFLLALYEQRNPPNRKAWFVTGSLVRLTFYCGLNRMENSECAFLESDLSKKVDIDGLRFLFWSIYILDTRCNLALGAPSNIDFDMVNTALPQGTIEDWTKGKPPQQAHDLIFLRNDLQQISDTVRRITRAWGKPDAVSEVDINFCIRVILQSRFREACNLEHMSTYCSAETIAKKWKTQFDLLTALRLALPAGYLDPKQNLFSVESRSSHAMRLHNLIELNHALRIMSMLKLEKSDDSDAWLRDWDIVINITDDVIEIIKQWDMRTVHLADPVIGFVVFMSMVVVHIDSKLDHRRGEAASDEEGSQIAWQLLLLFLHQLSTYWSLPKALIAAAENLRNAASCTLSIADASEILKLLRGPLRPYKSPRRAEDSWIPDPSNVSLGQDQCFQDLFGENDTNGYIGRYWSDFNILDSL